MLAAGPELRITGAAAQTRMVSVARIRLVSRKSTRLFKGIICDDISEFESHMPSHAVGLGSRLKSARTWDFGGTPVNSGGDQTGWLTIQSAAN
jgi:hypothetical protein